MHEHFLLHYLHHPTCPVGRGPFGRFASSSVNITKLLSLVDDLIRDLVEKPPSHISGHFFQRYQTHIGGTLVCLLIIHTYIPHISQSI